MFAWQPRQQVGCQGIWILLPLRIIFCMSERSASERIADLDPNHQVIDIGLALPTHCWWCMCSLWARSAPGTCWMRTLISDRWNTGGCLEHPAWCLWRCTQTAGWWVHQCPGWRLGISGHPPPAATSPSLCSGQSVLLWRSLEAPPLQADIRT